MGDTSEQLILRAHLIKLCRKHVKDKNIIDAELEILTKREKTLSEKSSNLQAKIAMLDDEIGKLNKELGSHA